MIRVPHLLVVEGDRRAAELLARIFEVDDYDVSIARDVDLALKLARSERPDAILLDLELPTDVHGGDLLRTLRMDATLRDVPVVALSTAFELARNDFGVFGPNAVIRKPLVEESLLLLLDRVHGFAPPMFEPDLPLATA
ncbi:MAG: response regulator [Polyangiaceae bacterium]|nr:response regulator [Polyangiaceae bacterium]